MERGRTLFLKATVYLIGVLILAVCIFGLPSIGREAAEAFPDNWVYPVVVIMYISVIPLFVALYQALKLLSYIDKNTAFSELSVLALKVIKHCAVTISILHAACLPFLYLIADLDDAPGLILFGMVIPAASMVIAVFAAVLQRLLKSAIDIQSENDLTV
ncbi:DUF2975 domain-containing protein [Paenibacillus zeisoli]|uniref:DUF2975 domain-containing protein n=1 Tax=Paenibacillus zeisoli TaxID=2496267 RepID=A0A433X961_9BACL|nr:DUF2975 domain-containing protein [Paenibacillus zeisoli]RUT30687.1 DUF2975 domain-containing protein [Paenibacillus zeisoli]